MDTIGRPGRPARIDRDGPALRVRSRSPAAAPMAHPARSGRRRRVPAGGAPARRQDRAGARARGVRRSGRGRHPADGDSLHGDPLAPRGGGTLRRDHRRGTARHDVRRGRRPGLLRVDLAGDDRLGSWGRRPRTPSAFLERLHERGVRGLPIGPDPSAVLANAVLAEMDRAIRSTRRSTSPMGRRHRPVGLARRRRHARSSRSTTSRTRWASRSTNGRRRSSQGVGEARAGRARRAGLLYHRGAVRTLYRASRVVTLSHPTMGEWILVDERHVQRVGTGDPPEADLTIELPGTTIVPGFIDSHVHLTATGRSLMNEDVRGDHVEGGSARPRPEPMLPRERPRSISRGSTSRAGTGRSCRRAPNWTR